MPGPGPGLAAAEEEAAESEERDEASEGVGSERAEATSVRQMRMRCCLAGGMRGLVMGAVVVWVPASLDSARGSMMGGIIRGGMGWRWWINR